MFWLLIILAVVGVGTAGIVLLKNSNNVRTVGRFNELSNAKLDAYCDDLRRTSDDEDLLDMNDAELRDYLQSVMRDYHKETFDMKVLMIASIVTGIVLGVFFWLMDGSLLQLAGCSIGGIVVGLLVQKYCILPIKQRHSDKTGIDIGRLVVDGG